MRQLVSNFSSKRRSKSTRLAHLIVRDSTSIPPLRVYVGSRQTQHATHQLLYCLHAGQAPLSFAKAVSAAVERKRDRGSLHATQHTVQSGLRQKERAQRRGKVGGLLVGDVAKVAYQRQAILEQRANAESISRGSEVLPQRTTRRRCRLRDARKNKRTANNQPSQSSHSPCKKWIAG